MQESPLRRPHVTWQTLKINEIENDQNQKSKPPTLMPNKLIKT